MTQWVAVSSLLLWSYLGYPNIDRVFINYNLKVIDKCNVAINRLRCCGIFLGILSTTSALYLHTWLMKVLSYNIRAIITPCTLLLLELDKKITEIIIFLASPDLLFNHFFLWVDIVGNYSYIMLVIIWTDSFPNCQTPEDAISHHIITNHFFYCIDIKFVLLSRALLFVSI